LVPANSDLNALATGNWDATIDTSAYVPRQVRSLAEVLGGGLKALCERASLEWFGGVGPGVSPSKEPRGREFP
jgi:hypothetical protein